MKSPEEALAEFYDACAHAPVPDLPSHKREPLLRRLLVPSLGLATGLVIALALIVGTPMPDRAEGREAAEAMTRLQLANSAPKPAARPRASVGGNLNA
jgi:hypothetical protein